MNSQNRYKYVFSVVTYGAPQYFDRFLRNLYWTKNRKDIRISIIDNSPNDDIKNILDQHDLNTYYEKTNKNLGYGKGHNRTYKLQKNSKPEFFFILNPDLILEEDAFESLAEKISTDPKLAVVAPSIIDENGTVEQSVFTDPSGFAYFRNFTKQFFNKNTDKRLGLEVPQDSCVVKGVTGACMLIRASAIKGKKLYDPDYFMYFEDLDLCTRLRNDDWGIFYLKEATVLHSIGKSSDLLEDKDRWLKEMMYKSLHTYFEKNKGKSDQRFLNLTLKTALRLRIVLGKDKEWAIRIQEEIFNPQIN